MSIPYNLGSSPIVADLYELDADRWGRAIEVGRARGVGIIWNLDLFAVGSL